jgi:hypothetical protein
MHREEVDDLLPVPSYRRFRDIRSIGSTPDDLGVEQPVPWIEIATSESVVGLT